MGEFLFIVAMLLMGLRASTEEMEEEYEEA